MTPLEREFKIRLPRAELRCALEERFAGWPAARVLQVNHFFDTPGGALRAARLALRLREEDGRFAVALKGPEHPGPAGLAVRAELEREVDAATARAVLVGERSPLELLDAPASVLLGEARARAAGAALVRVGGFENERLRLGPRPFPPGPGGPGPGPELIVELDRTRFPDGSVEHELELELPEGADAAAVERDLRALCAELGVPFEAAPSKAARCFQILDRLAGERARGSVR